VLVLLCLGGVAGLTTWAAHRDAERVPSGTVADRLLGAALSWAPPTMENPITIEVGRNGGEFTLQPEQDYRIVLTETVAAPGGVSLIGGRDIVLIGGHITIPWTGADADGSRRRALLLQHQTGTVHIEGLLIDNAGGDLSEGIQIDAKRAVVQIQNVRITGIHAHDEIGFTDNHPDLIQPWGGARELLIDHFTGTTDYQGFFLVANYGELGRVVLRNVNVTGTATAKYLLWKAPESGPTFPLEFDNVWFDTTATAGRLAIWPDSQSTGPCRVLPAPDRRTVSWLPACNNTGTVQMSPAPDGDFVPAGEVGLGYVSPGYR
jgi:hypothetical protein